MMLQSNHFPNEGSLNRNPSRPAGFLLASDTRRSLVVGLGCAYAFVLFP